MAALTSSTIAVNSSNETGVIGGIYTFGNSFKEYNESSGTKLLKPSFDFY